jgi:hypothetical protein
MIGRRLLAGAMLALAACRTDGPTDVTQPFLESVEPAQASPGSLVKLLGRGFAQDAADDLVLIDGVRARVRSASQSALEVEVPQCMPPRRAAVTVTVLGVTTREQSIEVREGGPPALSFGVGEDRTIHVLDGSECLKLAGGATYLLVAQSVGTVAGASYEFSLKAMSALASDASAELVVPRASSPVRAGNTGVSWEAELRRWEQRALEQKASRPARSRVGSVASVVNAVPPSVGDERRFQVADASGRFQEVRALVKRVSERAAFYQDVDAPGGGLSDADIASLARDFDDPVFPVVTGAFGGGSDLDQNDRIVVLLTPAVNRLTPAEASGFVGGFFFGVDLVPGATGGNSGEILYALVPDPEGRFGAPRTLEQVRSALPSILAHELQHLVHFNQRMRVRQAPRNEAVWLSEALAQSAELLVGDTLVERGRMTDAQTYFEPTFRRARDYLTDPPRVSLLVSFGAGTLGERGAGWLFLRYLQGHHGGMDMLRSLAWSTRTGIENIEAVTGRSWPDLYSDWSVATFTDGLSGFATGRLQYPDVQLRRLLVTSDRRYPLTPTPLPGEAALVGARLSGSSEYYLLDATKGGSVSVRLASASGGTPAAEARFILRVVRIQ